MTIGKLSRLFSTLGKSANTQDAVKTSKAVEAQPKPVAADAVNLRISKQTTSQPVEGSSDPEKIARIRQQVADGSYKVDSKKVAVSFMNELGLS